MCKGLFKITSPWKENNNTNISSKPTIVALLNLGRNLFSKYSVPFLLLIYILVNTPAVNGTTTNKTTDIIKVSQGTDTLLTPSKNFTIGTNATRIIKSLVATCT